MAARLIPHFRLLSKCISKQQNGDMQDIDALLGCPLWMPKCEKIEAMSPQELNYFCDVLFYCLNWLREMINTFSNTTGELEDDACDIPVSYTHLTLPTTPYV